MSTYPVIAQDTVELSMYEYYHLLRWASIGVDSTSEGSTFENPAPLLNELLVTSPFFNVLGAEHRLKRLDIRTPKEIRDMLAAAVERYDRTTVINTMK